MLTIIGITNIVFLIKVLSLDHFKKTDKVISWMKTDNDKSGIDIFEI